MQRAILTFGIIVSVGLGVLLGVGGYTFVYAKGTSYLTNDPRACANCHVMNEQYDGWMKASHMSHRLRF
ncbi:MAG: NapC/NirT family cytochrome c [Candidatus Hydrogenedentes bacterium]|nr:NapC/NirT family cytochrome c [Candidatus Hydrogenedentota bacterium]